MAQRPLSYLQYPVLNFKSFTKDLSLPIFKIVSASPKQPFTVIWCRYNVMILAAPESAAIHTHDNIRESNVSAVSSMDSGLEAFSLNPTRGSVSALTFQSTEFANYVNHRFLSY